MNAGYYLLAKLGMRLESELDARELFEIDHVSVDKGLIRCGQLPRSRFFLWEDPRKERDLLVFLGEAQPPTGLHAYCRRIVDHARELGVERVFTFAAMATQMHLGDPSRVFAAATSASSLRECRKLELEVLEEGHISGLNGVLPGVAAEAGLDGTCLLGEMPHLFSQLAFPQASLEVLRVFLSAAGITLDLSDLEEEAELAHDRLEVLLHRIEGALRDESTQDEVESFGPPLEEEPQESPGLDSHDRERIENLFEEAARDRSKAYQLKQELDRLRVFGVFEDRFLDLFREQEPPLEDEGS